MNKGTAILGFLLSYVAGMFFMWGMGRHGDSAIGGEASASALAGSADHSAAKVPVTKADPAWGKPTAPVTIVEISDFECPFCSRVGPTLAQVKEKYGPDKVRIVWKHNPLPFHKAARPTHEAAATVQALGGSDAFWKFHDSAFANQKGLSEQAFEKWVTEAGVDLAKFKADYGARKYAAKVDEDMAVAKRIGASGTPAFRINGVTLSGAQPFAKFAEIIDAQLAEAEKLVKAGTKPQEVYVALTNKNMDALPAAPAAGAKDARPAAVEDKGIWTMPVLADDPVKGPRDALVTLVVFSEFQCPFCKRVEDTLRKVMDAYPAEVRVVWKDNPLAFHPRARPAATLARFAYETKGVKGFWEVHDALFESQPKLEEADLQAIAEKLKLDWAQAKAAIDADKYATKINASMALATSVKAGGTPHFFVNGVRLAGAQPFDAFKTAIEQQLVKAKALVAKGVPKAQIYDEVMKEAAAVAAIKKDVPLPQNATAFRGFLGAKVSIQVFSEFQCPDCQRVDQTLQALETEYDKRVRVFWRHLPQPSKPDSLLAAQAAQEAFAQKANSGFWKFHDALFAAAATEGGLKRPNLEKIAAEQGLDVARFKGALDEGTHKDKIQEDWALSRAAALDKAPGVVINGYYVSGAQPASELRKYIELALKETGS